ncbi:MAG: RagB/SusD family nutrient uptake outer membrane protein, partial [Leadbetterella sp.]
MKKRLIQALAVLGTTFVLGACDTDFSEVKNEANYDDASYFRTQPQFNEAVLGVYSILLNKGFYSRDWYFIFDLMGNDAERSAALLGDLQQLSEYTHPTGHPQVNDLWVGFYRMVFRANLVLDKTKDWNPTTDNDKKLKTQYIAEARFLRGYANFHIAMLWGNAPLRKSYQESSTLGMPRTSVNEIWKFAEEDFAAAATDLPARMPAADKGRATKAAAQSMLGKAFLYQKKYADAATQFEKVVNEGGYKLNASYDDQFSKTNNSSAETIMDVPHRWFGWGNNGANAYYMFGGQEAWGGRTTHTGRAQEYGFNDWNNVFVSDALMASFKYKDETGKNYIDPRAALVAYGDAASGADTAFCDACSKGKIKYNYAVSGYKWRKYEPYEFQEKIGEPNSEINSQV